MKFEEEKRIDLFRKEKFYYQGLLTNCQFKTIFLLAFFVFFFFFPLPFHANRNCIGEMSPLVPPMSVSIWLNYPRY